jgi:Ser/Thr protein kinase RdoA (MazF antagonist)
LLRSQVLHNDFSAHNVLVDPARPEFVTGVLDFGDVVETAIVFDLAIAMANLLDGDADDPWQPALDLAAGYLAEHPVAREELGLVPIAAVARLVQRALVSTWRAEREPARAAYVLSHAAHDWATARASFRTSRPDRILAAH